MAINNIVNFKKAKDALDTKRRRRKKLEEAMREEDMKADLLYSINAFIADLEEVVKKYGFSQSLLNKILYLQVKTLVDTCVTALEHGADVNTNQIIIYFSSEYKKTCMKLWDNSFKPLF
jgi:hypothetical protein